MTYETVPVVLLGTVVVFERDRRSRLRALGIRAGSGENHVVDPTPMADLLYDYIGHIVLARGDGYTDAHGSRRSRILSFEPQRPGVDRRARGPGDRGHSDAG